MSGIEPIRILRHRVREIRLGNENLRRQVVCRARCDDYLGINAHDHASIQAEFVKSNDQYYELLGLTKGASVAELKKAYRKLALTHHPDRVSHLGEEYKKIAEEKFKKISEAHQIILKELVVTQS